MSDYNFDDKPKNDFYDDYGKPKNDDYSVPERGGCLNFFLAFLVVANLGILVFTFSTYSELQSLGTLPPSVASQAQLAYTFLSVQVIISIGIFACVYGLWNWKRWGYYGLIVIYGINILIGFFTGQSTAIGGFIGIAILYYLMKDKTQYLE
jgi:oligosaccharide repeat unit polymerase